MWERAQSAADGAVLPTAQHGQRPPARRPGCACRGRVCAGTHTAEVSSTGSVPCASGESRGPAAAARSRGRTGRRGVLTSCAPRGSHPGRFGHWLWEHGARLRLVPRTGQQRWPGTGIARWPGWLLQRGQPGGALFLRWRPCAASAGPAGSQELRARGDGGWLRDTGRSEGGPAHVCAVPQRAARAVTASSRKFPACCKGWGRAASWVAASTGARPLRLASARVQCPGSACERVDSQQQAGTWPAATFPRGEHPASPPGSGRCPGDRSPLSP